MSASPEAPAPQKKEQENGRASDVQYSKRHPGEEHPLSAEEMEALKQKYLVKEGGRDLNPALSLPKWSLAPHDLRKMGLEHYDVRILLALLKSLQGHREFFQWLMDNGYPEVAAFSNAVCGDKEAMKFLFHIHCEWLAILSNAIDGEEQARVWIGKACKHVNLMFAMACQQDPLAIKWLQTRQLDIFLVLAQEIHEILDTQASENSGPYVYHVND